MLQVSLPGTGDLVLTHLVCDMNGTLAVDGEVSDPVCERLGRLAAHLQIHLLSADTYGTLDQLVDELRHAGVGVLMERVTQGEDKAT